MRKLLALTLCLSVLMGMAASVAEESNQKIMEIDASEETARYREEKVFAASDEDPREQSEEEQLASFNASMEKLRTRTTQTFPEFGHKNILTHEACACGDVYSLCADENYATIVLYIHGGAWTAELNSFHVKFCDMLVDELNAKVYMPLYPLAPEATATEGYEMILQVYSELLAQNKPIIVMGDSAGATIALGLALTLKENGTKLPEKVVVMSPCADASFTNPEILTYQKLDAQLPYVYCRECAKLWAGGRDLSEYILSPITGDYSGFPDTLIYAGTYDILFPDEMKLYEKMCASGVNVTLVKGNGFWHVYPFSDVQEKPQLIQILKDFCAK